MDGAFVEAFKKKEEQFLKPLRSKLKSRRGVVFDFETKDDDTQVKGWTRPFLLGFDDGEQFISFRNDDEVMDIPWRLRHLFPGGLVDKFMRFLTACGDKYQSKECALYAHNGGKFDNMYVVGWLLKHQDEFEFEIASVQSRIQRLDFWPRGQPKKLGYWTILDSIALLPMSLKKVGETFTPGDAEKMAMDLDLPEWTTGISVKPGSWFCGTSRAEAARTLRDQGLTAIGLVREHIGKKPPLACPHIRTFTPASAIETNVLDEPGLKSDPCPECKREADEETMLPLDGAGNLMDGDTILVVGRQLDVAVRLAWSDTETFDVWEAYNALDCKVLRLGLERFHNLVEDKLGGEVGMTAPATSMKLYRRRYQEKYIHRNAHFKECTGHCKHGFRTIVERGKKKGVSIAGCGRAGCDSQCHGCAHEWVRLGYYGGRTELFCEWGFDLRYYDVNSSYPASMLRDMPVGRMVVPKNNSPAVLRELAKTHVGFIECEVEIPRDCVLPPLPYRVPEGKRIVIKRPSGEEYVVPPGKLIFPTGKLTGVWDWEELKLLDHPLVRGKITRIIKSVWYEKSPVFAEMVNDLYRYRQKHLTSCFNERGEPTCGQKQCNPDYNEGLSFCAKLMLNSLYGKFGMREERTGLILVPEGSPWPDHGWPIDGEHETCRVWEVERLAHASYIVPQISAHITSLSRIILFNGMADILMHGMCTNKECRDEHGDRTRVFLGRPPLFATHEKPRACDRCGSAILRGKIYYSDTDSIVTNIDLAPKLVNESILGLWKREEPKILLSGNFRLPKLYQLIAHEENCKKPRCKGCKLYFHKPSCKSKKCKGCATTKQRMKGVGGQAQTAEVYDAMIGGKTIRAERVAQHKEMIKRAMGGDEKGFTVTAHKKGQKTPDRFFHDPGDPDFDDDGRVKRSLRTMYDKRVLVGNGDTIPIHIAA